MQKMDWVYLDNNATTRPAPEVVEVIDEVHRQLWANPSSVHRFGQAVRHRVELARAAVAALIGCQPRELVFTSGGTESCNLALWGVLDPCVGVKAGGTGVEPAQHEKVPVLITTAIEHSAVRGPAEVLVQRGVLVKHLPVDRGGWVDADVLPGLLEEVRPQAKVVLVSVQWVNNETGAIQPVEALAEHVRRFRQGLAGEGPAGRREAGRVLLHVDATQAVGKLPVDVGRVGVDLLTLSGHKFHGPKGVGALYVRSGVRVRPQMVGGPQEMERRGGTENTAGIIGLGVAAELAKRFLENHSELERLEHLRDRFEREILTAFPGAGVVVNSGSEGSASIGRGNDGEGNRVGRRRRLRVWNTTNLGFPRLEAEGILVALSERGVCASAGAACSSGSLEPSPVLLAMGVPEEVAHGSVRFSLSRMTTDEDIRLGVSAVVEVVDKLSRVLPVRG